MVEVITIGDELLDGRRIDTNSAWLGRQLSARGVSPRFHQTVADRTEEISEAFRLALTRADIVLSTGGLGPTSDDVTFEALALATGKKLEFRPEIFARIEEKFRAKNLVCTPSNRRQAEIPEGATELQNDWGTAPGVRLDVAKKVVFVLPGVPHEMEKIFTTHILPDLEKRLLLGSCRTQRTYRLLGLPESQVADRLERLNLKTLAPAGDLRIAYTASFREVDITLSLALAPEGKGDGFGRIDERIQMEFGDRWVATDDETLASRVISELRQKGWKLAVAESMTGGLLSASLVDIPGSSEVLDRSWVTYSDAAKRELLGVAQETLRSNGAVSEECAREMAKGALTHSGAAVAVSVTGIAGPGGATAEKPAGLTYMTWRGPSYEESRKYEFHSDRNGNRMLAAAEALRGLLKLCRRVEP